ncbi:MAG: hypothetical protein IPJ98_24180 [Bryobacterales bacterium]|nr:hypothetical protein [Bryobacterales bacterium]
MNITSTIAFASSLFCLTAASAQVALRPPFLGCHIAGEQGQLRVLEGVRGAVAATRLGTGVVAAACSESRLLHHTGRHLILDQDGRRESFPLEGHFLLALDGEHAVAVNTDTGSVLHLVAGEWLTASFQLPAGIRAIRLDEGRLTVLTTGRTAPARIEAWDLAAGALLASDPIDVPVGPAALLSSRAALAAVAGTWLHCTPSSCTALSPAPHTTLPLTPLSRAPLSITPLSDGWMAAAPPAGLPFAVRIHHGVVESFYLPGESLE